jgi:benzoyl-CoA reductase/2-hydroxyglutaryl-CoA dehydratase subunit BcrC/BadD/HgdB
VSDKPRTFSLADIDALCEARRSRTSGEHHSYSGPLLRHVREGDRRLVKLTYDDSQAALRLWNFLLTEEDRLRDARASGKNLVGTMKDLGTVPVLCYSYDNVRAFYPDGAWWIPCVMEMSAGLMSIAQSAGAGESMCPVRAMLGAFLTGNHFPVPDMLVSSVGATCDDFSAVAQRLESLGFDILWWEIPARRAPDEGEAAVELPGGFVAPRAQVSLVKAELVRIRDALDRMTGHALTDEELSFGIRQANVARRALAELRHLVFLSDPCPLPALELLIAEMLIIHFCSDRGEATRVIDGLLEEVRTRVASAAGVLSPGAVRVFWVNPVADLRVMNLLEECGGRLCGTEFLFCHALDEVPEDLDPMEALARTALADPMAGPAMDRAKRICKDMRLFGAEAVVISRIPGASHCACEGAVIAKVVRDEIGVPTMEIEVPPLTDAIGVALRTRLEALVETATERRRG